MTPAYLAALYEAAESVDDDGLVLAIVRALEDPDFAKEVRRLLEAAPATRASLSTAMSPGRPKGAANL